MLADIADPVLSNLPPEVFAETTALAAEVITSYTAGRLHDDFGITRPAGFPAEHAGCCPEVTILAAGAYSDPTDETVVQVTVAWDGRNPGHRETFSTVFVVHDPVNGQWRPAEDPEVDER